MSFNEIVTSQVPRLLQTEGSVQAEDAEEIGQDILHRAQWFRSIPDEDRKTLAAAFYEESFDHRPLNSSGWTKAFVTVVVRNSKLENAHSSGQISDVEIKQLTTMMAPSLEVFLSTKDEIQSNSTDAEYFYGLRRKYPRAWSALEGAHRLFVIGGGQIEYRYAASPSPTLEDFEIVDNIESQTKSKNKKLQTYVFNAIDERVDTAMYDQLVRAAEDPLIFGVTALSRFSRNSEKQFRIIEFLIAHECDILTSNMLITPKRVFVRSGALVKPVSNDPIACMFDLRGVGGVHKKKRAGWVELVTM